MDQINRLEQNAKAVRSRIAFLLFCKYFLYTGTVCAFIAGTVLVILNVSGKNNPDITFLLCFTAAVIPIIVAATIAFTRRVPLDKIIVLLDKMNRKGGILLEASAAEDSGWQEALTDVNIPSFRLDAAKPSVIFIAALAFVIAVLLMPPAQTERIFNRKMEIARETGELEEQVQLLQEEKIITPEEAASMEAQIKKIEKNASGQDPVKTWEALDHMHQSLKSKAGEAAEKTVRQADAMALSEKALEAMLKAREKSEGKDFAMASKAMSEAMQKLLDKCPKLSDNLSKELKNALDSGSLSPEDMEKLLKAQQITQEQLEELLKKLNKSGLCNNKSGCSGQGSKLKAMTQEELKQLMKMLDEGSQKKCSEQQLTCIFAVCSGAGKGGVSRGRGDAPMTWWDKGLDRDEAGFKDVTLPSDAVNSLEKSKLIGVTYGAAKVAPDAKVSTGHLDAGKVDGTRANRYILMPKHRTVVKKYFTKD